MTLPVSLHILNNATTNAGNEKTTDAQTASLPPFSASFASLPSAFHTRLLPTPLPQPYLVAVSPAAAAIIGVIPEAMTQVDHIDTFTGNAVPDGAAPLAAVYSGHQFGVWAGQLGACWPP